MLKSVSKSIPGDVSLIYEQQDAFSEARHSSSESGNPSLAESLAQINRIVKSDHLYSSETLGRLLEYLAQHTLNSPDDHLKEYRIATEILNRGSDFDPRYDASVRVQIGRLRTKLAGVLQFHRRTRSHTHRYPQGPLHAPLRTPLGRRHTEGTGDPAPLRPCRSCDTNRTCCRHQTPCPRPRIHSASRGCRRASAGWRAFLPASSTIVRLRRPRPVKARPASPRRLFRSSGILSCGDPRSPLSSSVTQPLSGTRSPACAISTLSATRRTTSRTTTRA